MGTLAFIRKHGVEMAFAYNKNAAIWQLHAYFPSTESGASSSLDPRFFFQRKTLPCGFASLLSTEYLFFFFYIYT
jgi:hypothetical protein